jgi:hypothetical protein
MLGYDEAQKVILPQKKSLLAVNSKQQGLAFVPG